MADSDIVPVVHKDLFEISRDRRVIDNDPGVAVLQHARTGPILAADDNPLMVNNEALVMDALLDTHESGVDAGRL